MYDASSDAYIVLRMSLHSGIIYHLVIQVKRGDIVTTTYSLMFADVKPELVYNTILKVLVDRIVDFDNPIELVYQYGGSMGPEPIKYPSPPAHRVN